MFPSTNDLRRKSWLCCLLIIRFLSYISCWRTAGSRDADVCKRLLTAVSCCNHCAFQLCANSRKKPNFKKCSPKFFVAWLAHCWNMRRTAREMLGYSQWWRLLHGFGRTQTVGELKKKRLQFTELYFIPHFSTESIRLHFTTYIYRCSWRRRQSSQHWYVRCYFQYIKW